MSAASRLFQKLVRIIDKKTASRSSCFNPKGMANLLEPIHYCLMTSVDLQALKTFYTNKPPQLAKYLREYIAAN